MIFLLFIICGIQRESLFLFIDFSHIFYFYIMLFSYIYNKIDIIKIIFFLFCEAAAARSANRRESHSYFLFASLQTVFETSQSHSASVLKHHLKQSNNSLLHIISARIWSEQEETDLNEKFYCDKKIYFVILLNRVVA